MELFGQLESAVQGGIISEELFAKQLVARVGPDMARATIQRMTPDHIQALVREHNAGAALAQSAGRTYLRNLWAEIAKLV